MKANRIFRPVSLATAVCVFVVAWWALGRVASPARRLTVRHSSEPGALHRVQPHPSETPAGEALPDPVGGSPRPVGDSARLHPLQDTLRVLAWNIAHGRGDVRQGWTNNWRGGTEEERRDRMNRIAEVIRQTGAQVVVLNEVDFDAHWSHGMNQAAFLARTAGFPTWVEQRNYDLSLPFLGWAFGNALLTSLPLKGAEWVAIPPHSRLEAAVLGAKQASVTRLELSGRCLGVVPVHLEVRSRSTRLKAVRAFRDLRVRETCPVILAGDFNSAPSGWPAAPDGTVLDSLLDLGWESPRALSEPDSQQWTFPTPDLRDARDWILVEPPLRVLRARIIDEARTLSDHAPVLAVIVTDPDTLPRE